MSAAASSAAGQGQPGDPLVVLTSQQDRDAWTELNMDRFSQLCSDAYQNGDFSYVKTLLQANHESMGEFLSARTAAVSSARWAVCTAPSKRLETLQGCPLPQ